MTSQETRVRVTLISMTINSVDVEKKVKGCKVRGEDRSTGLRYISGYMTGGWSGYGGYLLLL
jgi:hypothetical protein